MSCISSNFSSFFLNSLNDSSEFAKYLSNGELKFSSFEDFQVFGSGAGAGTSPASPSPAAGAAASSSSLTAQQAASQQQQQQQYYNGGVGNSGNNNNANISAGANATGLPSGIEQPYNNGVAAMNSIGNCGGTETANTSALTPANASNTAPAGVQQLQHGAHLHAAHHTPQHPNTHLSHHPHQHPHAQHPYAGHAPHTPGSLAAPSNAFHSHNHLASPHLTTAATTPNYPTTPQRWTTTAGASPMVSGSSGTPHPITQLQNSNQSGTPIAANPSGAQHFDGSFEFLKYLRHSNDYNNSEPQGDAVAASASAGQVQASSSSSSSLIDLDSSTSHKSRSSRKAAALLSSVSRTSNSLDANALDVFDHDSKHTIFDMHHMTATNSSNSNESSMEVSNLAFPSSHLNASNSNTSSEGAATGSSDFAMLHSSSAASAPKPLATFTIKDNFDVHPSHKVEEGIFQHMNKLPAKKKENLKQLGVRFTGQMTLSDKSIVVENFIKFCQEYDVQDHRPFLSLNQSGLNKADQIKFARYLGQGLPTFTLFCIYSNFKNLFCTKRTEIYTKDGYNLPYILDKTKRFLSNTTAGNTPSKGNPSSSHSQTQPQSQSLPQSQPQSQQQQQQAPSQSQQQSTPQTQQQTAPNNTTTADSTNTATATSNTIATTTNSTNTTTATCTPITTTTTNSTNTTITTTATSSTITTTTTSIPTTTTTIATITAHTAETATNTSNASISFTITRPTSATIAPTTTSVTITITTIAIAGSCT
ncbi:mucin-5AC isoform X2 [Bactrocera neohumeralis]|uniref:mucin-5AC isoform X2 n=1 Tax=Bactrocera neohumeralis TaxID=98809 RepID=UPI002165CC1F|nr:mucin-5AC isoform X2 [Bactrocera neohumeralis]